MDRGCFPYPRLEDYLYSRMSTTDDDDALDDALWVEVVQYVTMSPTQDCMMLHFSKWPYVRFCKHDACTGELSFMESVIDWAGLDVMVRNGESSVHAFADKLMSCALTAGGSVLIINPEVFGDCVVEATVVWPRCVGQVYLSDAKRWLQQVGCAFVPDSMGKTSLVATSEKYIALLCRKWNRDQVLYLFSETTREILYMTTFSHGNISYAVAFSMRGDLLHMVYNHGGTDRVHCFWCPVKHTFVARIVVPWKELKLSLAREFTFEFGPGQWVHMMHFHGGLWYACTMHVSAADPTPAATWAQVPADPFYFEDCFATKVVAFMKHGGALVKHVNFFIQQSSVTQLNCLDVMWSKHRVAQNNMSQMRVVFLAAVVGARSRKQSKA